MRDDFTILPVNLALCLLLVIATMGITILPSGALKYDGITVPVPPIDHLWVDAINGNNENDGLTRDTAFRSIQKASYAAGPGTTVHILPGIYRETVRPMVSGSSGEPVVYRAENGSGTVIIRGSERADTLDWNQLATNSIGLPPNVDPGNIYYADLSAWMLNTPPRFVVQLGDSPNAVVRLPLAREPDWQVRTEWKYHEFWWSADGGSTKATCDPTIDQNLDCDTSSRSTTQLTDHNSDSAPAGIEPGNLTTLGNLTGATLVAMDTNSGHYVYRRKIVAHDVAAGKITVDRLCEFDRGSGRPGLGWGSKYYVEDSPALLDVPGEWWYDAGTSRLFLWPPVPSSPATLNIEISRRDIGFQLTNRSYITLMGLSVELFDDSTIYQGNTGYSRSYNNTVRNATLRYANDGIHLEQGVDTPQSITDGFTLENSVISHMDSNGIYLNYWWPGGSADSFTHAGIRNTAIRNNEMYDLGFRSDSDNADGVQFNYPDRLRFENNHVHHIAHNGVIFGRSVIQSTKEHGFVQDEIKTGEILIKDNLFEKTCLLATDCGALKIWGSVPDNHVFRDMLINGNIFRNTFGWTYVSEKRRRWSGGTGSDVQGMGGFGLYVDNASGIHAYRNIAYNNSSSGFHLYNNWWDGDTIYYNNVAANSLHGIRLDGSASHGSINTQVVNNIIVNNEGYGILMYHAQGDYGNFLVDHNLYYNNGWRAFEDGGMWQTGNIATYGLNKYYKTLTAIQANTPWEQHGVEGEPDFRLYDVDDHDLYDKSWPDFHVTPASISIQDKGTTSLPSSLKRLLMLFDVPDVCLGNAFDIGPYEADVVITTSGKSDYPARLMYVVRLKK